MLCFFPLPEALQKANQAIIDHAMKHPNMRGMGATATLAGFLGSKILVGQIGDSRAYLIRKNEIELITKDQSFVYQLLEAGRTHHCAYFRGNLPGRLSAALQRRVIRNGPQR